MLNGRTILSNTAMPAAAGLRVSIIATIKTTGIKTIPA